MVVLSIGEFARVCGLTPKALRLYDDLGLLAPARVDPFSGYRYYRTAQLGRARLIARLRGVGMPLARIRVVCDLPSAAAAAEVASYWRQVEADVAARREVVSFLVARLSREEIDMPRSAEPVRLDHAGATCRGAVRRRNQDAIVTGRALFAVADGFGVPEDVGSCGGSEPGGEVGAAAAAARSLSAMDTSVSPAELTDALARGFRQARSAVAAVPGLDRGAGSTLTAVMFSGAEFVIGHIGDSRAYLLRAGVFAPLTHDHTYVRSLVDEGRLSAAEAATHPERTTLLRALHGGDAAEPDLHRRSAEPGDRYVLCTKGVHAVVDELGSVSSGGSPGEAVERIVGAARAAGAPDNLSCVVVDVHADVAA